MDFKIDQKTFYSIAETLEDRLRYFDYDPDHEILTVRMTSPIHDFLISFFNEHIREQLKGIAKRRGEAGGFASKIMSGGSSRLFLHKGIYLERPIRYDVNQIRNSNIGMQSIQVSSWRCRIPNARKTYGN